MLEQTRAAAFGARLFAFMRARGHAVLLALIFTAAFALRVLGAGWGTPYQLHVDETAYNLHSAVWMEHHWRREGWPRQEIISYGALPSYAFFAVRDLVMGHDRADYWLARTRDHQAYLRQGYTFDPRNARAYYWPTLTRLMRCFSALLYTLAVVLTWRVGVRLYGRWAGVLAALAAAGCAGMVQHAHYYTPEAFITLGSIAMLHACVRIAEHNQWRDYAYACAAMLLVASSKVTSAPICAFAALAAYAYQRRQAHQRVPPAWVRAVDQGRLWAAVVTAVVLWFWMNRVAFRHFDYYFNVQTTYSPLQQISAYRWGATLPDWALFYTDKPRTYFLTQVLADAMGRPLQLFALSGALLVLVVERGERRWPVYFAAVILAPLLLTQLQTIRYVVPALPMLCLCAARAVQRALEASRALATPSLRWASALAAALGALSLALGVAFGVAHTRMYLEPDNRIAAAEWLRARLRDGEWAAIEDHAFYAPTLGNETGEDVHARRVHYGRIWNGGENLDAVREWISHARYLVLDGWRMRLLDVPEARRRHPGITAFYDEVRARGAPRGFRLVAIFDNRPNLFGWRADESRSEILHVAFDHIPLYVYERIAPVPEAPVVR